MSEQNSNIKVNLLFRLIVITLVSTFSTNVYASDHSWYAGVWDSAIYNRAEKPHTLALRLEVRDAETDIPVKGARVVLRGKYIKEKVGRFIDPSTVSVK